MMQKTINAPAGGFIVSGRYRISLHVGNRPGDDGRSFTTALLCPNA